MTHCSSYYREPISQLTVQEYAIVLGRRRLHLCVHIFLSHRDPHFCVIADARSTAPQNGGEGETADGTGCADTVDTWLASQNVGNMIRCWILTDCRVRCCNKKGYARKRSRRLKTELTELPIYFRFGCCCGPGTDRL